MITESLKNLLAERITLKFRVAELEAESQKLREQRDAANALVQTLNRIIAGDVE